MITFYFIRLKLDDEENNFKDNKNEQTVKRGMGVWQGVATDPLKFPSGTLCPTLLDPAGGPPLKRPYSRFKGGLPACSLLLLWTPHAVRLCTGAERNEENQPKLVKFGRN
jgi:hypothetical protein